MKFNAVVGNPPFQKVVGSSKTPIGGKFVKMALTDLLTENGVMGMVVQAAVLGGGQTGLWRDFIQHTVVMVDPFANQRYFKVGIDICYFVLHKNNTPTSVVDYLTMSGITVKVDVSLFKYSSKKVAYLPRNISSPEGYDLLKKVIAKSSEVFDFRCSVSGPQTHKAGFGNAPRMPVTAKYFAITHTGEFLGKDAWVNHPCGLDEFYTNMNTPLDTTITTVLNGPLFHWLIKCVNSNQASTSPAGTSYLPKVDLNYPWTEAELYAHFNLTQEEIDYIESTVK